MHRLMLAKKVMPCDFLRICGIIGSCFAHNRIIDQVEVFKLLNVTILLGRHSFRGLVWFKNTNTWPCD